MQAVDLSPESSAGFRLWGVRLRFDRLRSGGWPLFSWLLGLGILILLAGVTWSAYWPTADALESPRDPFVWGLYIVLFMFLVGVSVGGLLVFSAGALLEDARLRPLRKVAVLQAAAAVAASMLCILPDVGRPERLFWFLLSPNPTSPFVLDAAVLNGYLALCAVLLWALLAGRAEKGRERWLASLALPAAVACIVVHGMIFGMARGRESWHSALLTPIFLASAMVSGVAVLTLGAALLQRLRLLAFPRPSLDRLGRILLIAIGIDLFLLACELLVTYWPLSSTPGHVLHTGRILEGRFLYFFVGEMVFGGLIPVLLLLKQRRVAGPWPSLLAAALVLGGVFLKRSLILVMGFAVTPMGTVVDYVPEPVEIVVSLGIVAVGILLATLGAVLFDLREAEPSA